MDDTFRRIFDNDADAIFIIDALSGRILDCNRTATGMLGYSREELLTLTADKIEVSATRDEIIVIHKRLKDEPQVTVEGIHKRRDGSTLQVEIHFGRLDQDSPATLICNVRDITERKAIELLLKDSNDRNRALVETTSDFIWEMDTKGTYTYCSPQMEALWGIDPKSMLGKTPFEFLPAEDQRRAIEGFTELFKSGDPFKGIEIRSFDGDGCLRWMEISGVPFFDSNGKLSGYRGITRDITERKQAEEEILRLNRLYAVISQVNQAVMRSTTQQDFFEAVCRILTEPGGFKLAWIGQVDHNNRQVQPVSAAGSAIKYVDDTLVYTDDRPEGCGPTGTCIREIKAVIQNDFMNDPNTVWWHEKAALYGFRGSAAFPILVEEQVWGALSVYSDTVGYFGSREQNLLEETAANIGFTMANFRREELREQAEEDLRDSEEKYALLVNHIPSIVSIVQNGKVVYANDQFVKLTGYSIAEVNAMDTFGTIFVSDREMVREYYKRRNAGESVPDKYDFRLVNRYNNILWIEREVLPIEWSGKPAIIAVDSDITERKQYEEKLYSSRQLLEEVINSLPARVFWKDQNLVYLGCNTLFARDAGFADPNDIVGKDDFQMAWGGTG